MALFQTMPNELDRMKQNALELHPHLSQEIRVSHFQPPPPPADIVR